MHAELARFIRRGRDHAALVPLPANHHGLAFERRIEQLFHGDEECVHIHVKDDSACGGHLLKIHQTAVTFVKFSLNGLLNDPGPSATPMAQIHWQNFYKLPTSAKLSFRPMHHMWTALLRPKCNLRAKD